MKIKKILATTAFSVALFIVTSADAHAYKVTDSSITKLSDTLTMYTLELQFGFLNADMWMPIAQSETLGEGNKKSSIMLSAASIQDNKYFVPMKTNATFTFLVLEEHAVGQSKGSVTVEKLPIIIQKKGEEKKVWTLEGKELEDFSVGK